MTSYKTRIKNTKDKEEKKIQKQEARFKGKKKRNRIITVTKFKVIDLQKLNSKPSNQVQNLKVTY